MQHDAAARPLGRLRFGLDLPGSWNAGLARLAIAWLVIAVVLFRDFTDIANQAWNSSTYNHILLIPAIIGWLVWQRGRELLKLEPEPWWPALIFAAGAAFLWLLGSFSELNLARQLGAVVLLMAAVPALLGVRVSAALLFPLFYMLMLVPFGDDLVPALQMITAAITIALVELSGIPAVIDGVFIDTPAGLFEVAEACSGVKFLIAMIALGFLVANVCFQSWKRRAIFFAACIIVPILANGVRAFGTIYAAQVVGIETAAGIDHIVYGWFFFAIVIATIIAGAWRFFDKPVDEPQVDAAEISASRFLGKLEVRSLGPNAILVGLGLTLALAIGWASAANSMSARLPAQLVLPQVEGWTKVEYQPQVWWKPRAAGADHNRIVRYQDAQGRAVDVFVALYAAQGEGGEAGGFGEGALMPESDWAWLADGPAIKGAKSERLLANARIERLALTWYRTGSTTTGSNARLKLATMASRLMLQERPTVTLIVSAETRPGVPAAAAVESFVGDLGSLDAWMDRMAGVR